LLLLRDRRWQSWVYTRDPVIPMLMKEHNLAGYVAREFAERGYWGRGAGVLALLETKLPNSAPRYAMLNYLSECPRADANNAATVLAAEQSY
jgi:hypothetical protein